jgi:hypothetical protein
LALVVLVVFIPMYLLLLLEAILLSVWLLQLQLVGDTAAAILAL